MNIRGTAAGQSAGLNGKAFVVPPYTANFPPPVLRDLEIATDFPLPLARLEVSALPAPRGLSRKALARAFACMERHIGERLGLEDVAREACVSRAHFARMFRISTGYSAMEYLLRLRVERAKPLLLEDRQSIADISAGLGFCDQSHFSRAFRRLTGLPPKRFARCYG